MWLWRSVGQWSGQGKTFANIAAVQLARRARFCCRISSFLPFFSEVMKCASCIGENEEVIPLLDLSGASVMKMCLHKNLPG